MEVVFEIHPVILLAVFGVAISTGFFIASRAARTTRWKRIDVIAGVVVLLPAAFLAVGVALWLFDPRIRAYKSFYTDIQIGMQREAVYELLARHYPSAGPRQRPTMLEDSASALEFFMAPEDLGEPNCEGIFLRMEGELVVAKRYSTD